MIQLMMLSGKWRIQIGEEIWEFSNKEDFKTTLDQLIELKDTYGRVK